MTRRVNRMWGLRWDSKALLKKMMGMGPGREPRVRSLLINRNSDPDLEALLGEAALIVLALGYKPNTLPLYDEDGERIGLNCYRGGPLVNERSQVVLASGDALANVYATGLASGFVPTGKMGGEPSFNRQTNSLWAYQNDIGEMIVNQLLGEQGIARRAA